MKQEFFNLEIETYGQNLYEFTDQINLWIKKNTFNDHILCQFKYNQFVKKFKRTFQENYQSSI